MSWWQSIVIVRLNCFTCPAGHCLPNEQFLASRRMTDLILLYLRTHIKYPDSLMASMVMTTTTTTTKIQSPLACATCLCVKISLLWSWNQLTSSNNDLKLNCEEPLDVSSNYLFKYEQLVAVQLCPRPQVTNLHQQRGDQVARVDYNYMLFAFVFVIIFTASLCNKQFSIQLASKRFQNDFHLGFSIWSAVVAGWLRHKLIVSFVSMTKWFWKRLGASWIEPSMWRSQPEASTSLQTINHGRRRRRCRHQEEAADWP